jgi:hypothetical protein
VVPQRGIINNVRVAGFNRQSLALVEGQKFTVSNCYGDGTLDVEADASNRTNDNHTIYNNDFNKIRISPLTGLGGTKTNNIVTDNRCNELSLWGGDGDVMTNNIVKGPIVLSQSGKVTIRGGSCYYFDQNVTNSTNVKHLIVDDLQVESSTALIGFEIKDVVKADIKANIKMTAVGSIGFQQNNNSTQAGSVIRLHDCEIDSQSHSIDLTVVGLGDTKHVIERNTLKSSSGRSISKLGASNQGEVVIRNNDIYAQPVVRNSTKITSKGNSYYDVAGINYDFNVGESISLVDEVYIDRVPVIALSSNTLTGSIFIKGCYGENVVISASKLSFTGTTALDVVFDELVTNSDAPYSGLTAPVRAGSKLRCIGLAAKHGRWYNGSVWSDLN